MLNNRLIAYSFGTANDFVEIYDIRDGSKLGEITLRRVNDDKSNDKRRPASLAGEGDTFVVLHNTVREIGEIIVIQLV